LATIDPLKFLIWGGLLANILFVLLSIVAGKEIAKIKDKGKVREILIFGGSQNTVCAGAINAVVGLSLFANSLLVILFTLGVTIITPITLIVAYKVKKRKLEKKIVETNSTG